MEDQYLAKLLKSIRRIAIVGLSTNPEKDSYFVAQYLQNQGYEIVPVNPTATEILGHKAYPDLVSVPGEIDVVNIFRPAKDVPPIVDQAVAKGAKAVWMQLGIVSQEAAEKARKAGLQVVMDRCIRIEHQRIHMRS
jgi:predicted CoA-binding protein